MARNKAAQFDAPADADDKSATGWAVYDRTLGRFVGSVIRGDKPAQDKAQEAAPGHTVAVVRV